MFMTFIPILSFGQDAAVAETEQTFFQALYNTDPLLLTILTLLVFVLLLVVIALVSMVSISSMLINEIQRKQMGENYVAPVSMWDRFKEKYLTGKLYSEKEEKTSMMLDHDYDGIREMDYGMPPWLTAIFVGTIVFAIAYLVQVWGLGTIKPQLTEYNEELAQAEIEISEWREKQANLIDENSVSFVSEEAMLAKGKEIFLKECKACHADDGGGGVGPNLTDDYWIHGGGISDVFSTIKYGVPEKGMISWQSKIKPGDMQNVASYILTLVGTDPANPKEPQGELYTKSDMEEVSEEVETEEEMETVESDSTDVDADIAMN